MRVKIGPCFFAAGYKPSTIDVRKLCVTKLIQNRILDVKDKLEQFIISEVSNLLLMWSVDGQLKGKRYEPTNQTVFVHVAV
jgi:hypothetical protein